VGGGEGVDSSEGVVGVTAVVVLLEELPVVGGGLRVEGAVVVLIFGGRVLRLLPVIGGLCGRCPGGRTLSPTNPNGLLLCVVGGLVGSSVVLEGSSASVVALVVVVVVRVVLVASHTTPLETQRLAFFTLHPHVPHVLAQFTRIQKGFSSHSPAVAQKQHSSCTSVHTPGSSSFSSL